MLTASPVCSHSNPARRQQRLMVCTGVPEEKRSAAFWTAVALPFFYFYFFFWTPTASFLGHMHARAAHWKWVRCVWLAASVRGTLLSFEPLSSVQRKPPGFLHTRLSANVNTQGIRQCDTAEGLYEFVHFAPPSLPELVICGRERPPAINDTSFPPTSVFFLQIWIPSGRRGKPLITCFSQQFLCTSEPWPDLMRSVFPRSHQVFLFITPLYVHLQCVSASEVF